MSRKQCVFSDIVDYAYMASRFPLKQKCENCKNWTTYGNFTCVGKCKKESTLTGHEDWCGDWDEKIETLRQG